MTATDASRWTAIDGDTDLRQTSSEDANGGAPASGAAQLARVNSAGSAVAVSDCITLPGNNTYYFAAMVKIPSTNRGNMQATVIVRRFTDAGKTETTTDTTDVAEVRRKA